MNDSPHHSIEGTARQCAAEMLQDILKSKRVCDEVFARHRAFATLSDRDRAFTRLLVLTTLRRLGQCDALLALLLERPIPEKAALVRQCLRLGIVQLLWLHTPPHAAVNSMVETTAAMGFESMKGLVNAVLKQVAAKGAALLAPYPEGATNLPAWLFESWSKAYGPEIAEAIASARLAEPSLDITVKENATLWAEKLGGTLLMSGSIRLTHSGRIELLPGFEEGAWWVQDVAATLPVQMLGDIQGKTALDLCAAPGGKTAQLAARGARVTAIDNAPRRLERVIENMARLKMNVETIQADILRFKPEKPMPIEGTAGNSFMQRNTRSEKRRNVSVRESTCGSEHQSDDVVQSRCRVNSGAFDIIVLDAPCSATGTLRRNPEVVWHKTRADCAELALLQRKMLARASGWVAVGGSLLYCVCSLQAEEGEMQIAQFLEKHPAFTLTRPAHIAPEFLTDSGTLRTHPAMLAGEGGMDGFFAALLTRVS